MRYLTFLLLLLLTMNSLSAQQKSRLNAGYLEILGNGIKLSVNYERQLSEKPGVSVHIGLGLGGYGPSIPVGLKYLWTLGNKNSFIETGAGITFAEASVWESDIQNTPAGKKYTPAVIPSFGYRYHGKRGFLFRINYTPVFTPYDDIVAFGGLSFGWRF